MSMFSDDPGFDKKPRQGIPTSNRRRLFSDDPGFEYVAPETRQRAAAPAPVRESDEGFWTKTARAAIGETQKAAGRLIEYLPETIESGLAGTADVLGTAYGLPKGLPEAIVRSQTSRVTTPENVEAYRRTVAPVSRPLVEAGQRQVALAGPGTFKAPSQQEDFSLTETLGFGAEQGLRSAGPAALALGVGALTRSPTAARAILSGGSYGQSLGGILESQQQQGFQDVELASKAALASAALDVISGGEAKVVQAVAKDAQKQLFREGAKNLTKDLLKIGAQEAATEVVQTGIERTGARQDLFSREALNEYIDSAAGGFGGGVVMGGGVRLLTGNRKPVEIKPDLENAGSDLLKPEGEEQKAAPAATLSFIEKDADDNDVVNVETIRANPKMALDELSELYSRDNIITSLAGDAEVDDFTKSLGARLHRAINSPNAKSIPNLVRNLKRDIDPDMHGEEVAAQRSPLVAKAALMLGDYVGMRNEAMAADERATNPALVAETVAQNNASEVARVQGARQAEADAIAAEQGRVEAERQMKLEAAAKEVETIHRKGFLDAVAKDPKTRDPVARFTALLKRNGFDPQITAQEQIELTKAAVGAEQRLAAEAAQLDMTVAEYKQQLAEDEMRQQQAESGTASMEAQIREAGSRAPTVSMTPKAAPLPPGKTNQTTPENFRLEMQSELTDADIEALQKAAARRQAKEDRALAKSNERAERRAAKQGEMFTPTGRVRKATAAAAAPAPVAAPAPKVTVSTKLKEKARATKEGQKPEGSVSQRERADEKRKAAEAGRGNRAEQGRKVPEKAKKVKPKTPQQKLAEVRAREAAAKSEQEARIAESKAKEEAPEVPPLEGVELFAYQNVSGQIDTALDTGEITPMQSRQLKNMIATRAEPGVIQQSIKDAAAQNKPSGKLKASMARGQKLKASTRADRAKLFDALKKELQRLGLNKVGLGVAADLIETTYGGKAKGAYRPGWAMMDIVFTDLASAIETLHHEAVHYMRDAGVITEAEWSTLSKIALADKKLMRDVDNNWKDLDADERVEEAIAEMFRMWVGTQKAAQPGVRGIFQKIKNFIVALQRGFNKPEFAEAKAIFQAIDAGLKTDKDVTTLLGDPSGKVKLQIDDRLENDNVPPSMGDQTSFLARKFNELSDKFARKAMTHTLIAAAEKAGLKSVGVYQDIELDKARVRYKIEQRISKILEGFDSLPAALREIGGPVNSLLQDSTMSGKWAFKPSSLKEGTYEIDPELQKRYDALPEAGKKFVREVFEANSELRQQLMDTVDAAIDEPYDRLIKEAEDAGNKDQVKELKREREGLRSQKTMMFRVDPTKPYASLRRQGKFVVSAKSAEFVAAQEAKDNKLIQELQSAPEHNYFNKFDTEAEANAEAKRLQGLGLYSDVIATTDDTVVNEVSGGRETFQAFQRIFKALENREGLSQQAKRTLQSVITDLHVMSMTNSSARKSEVKRKNVYGGDLDMVRNFATQSRAMAYHIASLKNNDMLMESINGMNKEVRSAPDPMEAGKFRDEILLRHMAGLRAAPNSWVESMKRLTAIYKIAFSPSFYIQNFTQVPMMVGPELAARGGLKKAVKLITGGMEEVAKAWKDTKWTESLNIDALPEDVRDVVQRLADISLIDVGLDADLGNMQSLRGRAGEKWGQTGESLDKAVQAGVAATNVAQDLTRKQESINRTVTAIAAYRLELERTGSRQKAIDYATDLVRNTMGTYDGFNAPRYMQGVGGIPFQFRKFQLMQITLLMRHIQNGYTDPNISPEERAIARQAFKYQLGTAALMGGIRGLPGASLLIWLYNTFFGDDDEPAEAETQIRKAVGDETFADLLIYGVPSLADINLSGMIGFGNTFSILPYTKLEMTKEGIAKAAFDLAGAGPATVRDIALSAKQTYDGLMEGREDYYRGLEKMLPKGFTNAVTAYREATEGVTNYKDDKLISKDDVTFFDTVKTLLGVQSVKTSERFRKQDAEKVLDQFFKDKAAKLKRQYIQAMDNKNASRREEIKAEWRKMQDARDKAGKKRQPLSILLRAKSEQRQQEEMTVGGVQYRAKDERYRQALAEEAADAEDEE
jgi:hypothetical protein